MMVLLLSFKYTDERKKNGVRTQLPESFVLVNTNYILSQSDRETVFFFVCLFLVVEDVAQQKKFFNNTKCLRDTPK